MNQELLLDIVSLKKAALIFRAINHRLRQQILRLIHEKEKMTVTEIFIALRLEQSVASQHLAVLRMAGLVTTKRDGKFVYYSVNYDYLEKVHTYSYQLLGQTKIEKMGA